MTALPIKRRGEQGGGEGLRCFSAKCQDSGLFSPYKVLFLFWLRPHPGQSWWDVPVGNCIPFP